MPNIDDLTNVYSIVEQEEPREITDGSTEEEKEQMDNYVLQKDLLIWYLDKYLPAAVGELTYSKDQRYYKRQTDSIVIKGKKRVLVERQQEAYGWLVLDNCYEKWCLCVPEQAKDPKWKVPLWDKDDPETLPFHKTKHSDPRGGQSAGWKPSARKALNDFCKKIKEMRDKDSKRDKDSSIYMKCLLLLKAEHGITEEEPLPKSSKRKRSKTATTVEEDDFMELDEESEAPLSDHTTGSEED